MEMGRVPMAAGSFRYMSADGSSVEEYEITRHGKLALATPGAKALTDFRAFIAALKALRHPKPEFSCSWFSGDVKALRWSSASAVAGRVVATLVLASLVPAGPAFCQASGKTVRHHKVSEDTPELAQAEAAIEKKDYATAE